MGEDATPDAVLALKVLDPAMGSGAFLVEACRQLAARLVRAWERHPHARPALAADEDAELRARRAVAQRCLYGVDKNPMAVDLARLSLWLATLARDHEFTFLDHALRTGDSLVGSSAEEIGDLTWPGRPNPQLTFARRLVDEALAKVRDGRRFIREAGDDLGEAELRPYLERVEADLRAAKTVGDAVVAAFFAEAKDKARVERLKGVEAVVQAGGSGWQDKLAPAVVALGHGPHPVTPFHWELEFPEVFDRANPGFDAVVGNPPFAGKNNVIDGNRKGYLPWLQTLHKGAHGNADLVAHFFRRAFGILRDGGALGLIATNTIRQGDTRGTGLAPIRRSGGTIYAAKRRIKWPGEAAVVVAVVHVHKGGLAGPYRLDGREVPRITAFLFHDGGDDDPAKLEANADKSFIGSYVLGMGFTFDDTDKKGAASPIKEMARLIEKDPRNEERIFPYIGGEEVNSSPTQAHHRYVINFENFPLERRDLGRAWAAADARRREEWLREGVVPPDYPEPVAADWPDLLAIVRERVKPEREKLPPKNNWNRTVAKYWWRFGAYRVGLTEAIRPLDRVLAIARVGEQGAFSLLPNGTVYSEQLVIIALPTHAAFCALQSRVHEVWARFFASSLEDRLRYTPSDCFETFPFPPNYQTNLSLEDAGKTYYETRANLMRDNNEGLTKTYNRFHDRDETSNRIGELRALHDRMDRAVLDAYGWGDLDPAPVFELEWENEDDEAGGGRRKKPWRYRWPEDVRDEVLARLLVLNKERHAAEVRRGPGGSRRAAAAPERGADGGEGELL